MPEHKQGNAPMDYQALATEITTGPLAAELTGKSDVEMAAILNDQRFTRVASRFVTARTILAELGAVQGATVLDKLEAAAAVSSPVKWMMRFLQTDGGVDIGHPQTSAAIDGLVAGEILTASEGAALQALAVVPASRAEILGLGTVTYSDVSRALNPPVEG